VVPHPAGPQRPRLRPHDPALARRLWYGAGSLGSVVWAAEHGLHLVVGNICAGQGLGTDDFGTAQLAQIRAYQAFRHQRTLAPIGERRILIARDLVGASAEIVESLRADPVLARSRPGDVDEPSDHDP